MSFVKKLKNSTLLNIFIQNYQRDALNIIYS